MIEGGGRVVHHKLVGPRGCVDCRRRLLTSENGARGNSCDWLGCCDSTVGLNVLITTRLLFGIVAGRPIVTVLFLLTIENQLSIYSVKSEKQRQ